MTLGGVLHMAWTQRVWIAGPALLLAVIGALTGQALKNRVRYRAVRDMEVTSGAEADAIFACKSNDVLKGALEGSSLENKLTPAMLAECITTELAGSNLVRLTVERSTQVEAERLVSLVAAQAAQTVQTLAREVSEDQLRAIAELEEDRRQVHAHHRSDQALLSQLMTEHPFVLGEHGEVISESRKQLSNAKEQLANTRRRLAEIAAEVAALNARLSAGTGTAAGSELTPSDTPAVQAMRQRIESTESNVAALREDLTDEHPRLVRLLSKRAELAAQLALMVPEGISNTDDSMRLEIRRRILEKEGEQARTMSRVSAYEGEVNRLTEYVKNEATATEEEARRLYKNIEDAEANIKAVRDRISAAQLAASQNMAAKAALSVREEKNAPPTEVIRAGATPGLFALIGAGIGLVFAAIFVAFAEVLNPVLRSSEDIRRHLDLPVLATIPGGAFKYVGPSHNPRTVGSLLWLVTFLVVAAMLLTLVYPGWDKLRTMLAPRRNSPTVEESQ